MTSVKLFYGPSAETAATNEALSLGSLVCPPLGKQGLKVDEARQAVSMLQSRYPGRVGVVLIGPIDEAAPRSCDTLLKSIEQPTEDAVPVLWAHDIGGVRPTIKSRCLCLWAPPEGSLADDELDTLARDVVDAALNPDRHYELPSLLNTENLTGLLSVVVEGIIERGELGLWERVRDLMCLGNPTRIEAIAALLPEK